MSSIHHSKVKKEIADAVDEKDNSEEYTDTKNKIMEHPSYELL